MDPQKVDFALFCHSVLDTESSIYMQFWTPASAGVTLYFTFYEAIKN
jgi:hypothetical protein